MKIPAFAVLLTLFVAGLSGCSRPAAGAAKPSDVDYYTCTMHPSVRSQDPDEKCPICGMDLVPVMRADSKATPVAAEHPREFTIAPERQQLIGVAYAAARIKPLRRTIRAAGVVAASTAKHWDYVARVDGYIRDLKVAAPGDRVIRGQVLMDLYSPDLVATEDEYLDLLRMRDQGRADKSEAAARNAERLLGAARARLEQWNISGEQIDRIERQGKSDPYLSLASPVSGIVEEVGVHQGRHVGIGDHLVDLVDLSSVWVWADFYEDELPALKPGLAVKVSAGSLPGFAIQGTIAVVDPFLDPAKRTGRVRIDVDNSGLELHPDAYVDVTVELEAGPALVVPVEAVLPTGQHYVVFVDKGNGRLEPRFIQVGGQFEGDYEVTSGLRPGERVVSSANFLIDAESKVQGALKDF